MHLIYRTADGRRHKARLTTDHCSSSYGKPVVVRAGVGYGTADLALNGMVFYAMDLAPAAAEALRKAGYSVC